jgi:hypothetical protein
MVSGYMNLSHLLIGDIAQDFIGEGLMVSLRHSFGMKHSMMAEKMTESLVELVRSHQQAA